MAIYQSGSINTTALIVPGLYVQIVPPQQVALNGVPSNLVGVVGTASWGPKNVATIIGSMAEYAANFGPVMPRLNDAGTVIAAATLQGANNFRVVRVTDGTDTAAATTGVASCITGTAIYTGSLGNSLVGTLSAGSTTGAWNFSIGLPGLVPEIYRNITGSGNAFWVNLASAVNNGNSISRGPSQLITLTAGAGTTAPAAATFTFASGADGVTTITPTVLMGTDGLTRTGMYALRGQGCSIGVIADCTTSSSWTTIDAFGLSEGIFMVQTAAAGLAISNGTTGTVDLIQAAGLNSYSSKLMHGDWIWYQDTVNGLIRLVSPQGFVAGRYANLTPNRSGLNQPIYGIVGTQKSGVVGTQQQQVYSQADLSALITAGVDVVMNPSAGGNYWSMASGHNTSSNAAANSDTYTRMTNYIAATLNAGMGQYVGQPITTALFQNITGTLLSFYGNLLQQGLLDKTYGLPYSVVCNTTNNPQSRTSLGYVQADSAVRYEGVNEKFLVNLAGGATQVIQLSTASSGS